MKKAFEGNTKTLVSDIELWLQANSPIKDKYEPEKESSWQEYQVIVEIL